MIATGYTLAGALIIGLFSTIGCCVFSKSAGAYDDGDEIVVAHSVVENGVPQTNGLKKYSKVDLVSDA